MQERTKPICGSIFQKNTPWKIRPEWTHLFTENFTSAMQAALHLPGCTGCRDARCTQPECNLYKVYNYMQAAYKRLQAACIRSVNLALGADPSLASTDSQWKQYFYDAQLSRLIPVCYISEKCNTFNYSQGSNQSQLVRSSQCSLKQSDRIWSMGRGGKILKTSVEICRTDRKGEGNWGNGEGGLKSKGNAKTLPKARPRSPMRKAATLTMESSVSSQGAWILSNMTVTVKPGIDSSKFTYCCCCHQLNIQQTFLLIHSVTILQPLEIPWISLLLTILHGTFTHVMVTLSMQTNSTIMEQNSNGSTIVQRNA